MSNSTRKRRTKSDNGFDQEAINWARKLRMPDDRTLKQYSLKAYKKATLKSVLNALVLRASGEKHSTFAGLKLIARDTELSRPTVSRALALLERLDLIHREPSADRKTDTIFLHVGSVPKLPTVSPTETKDCFPKGNATVSHTETQTVSPGYPEEEDELHSSSSQVQAPVEGGSQPLASPTTKSEESGKSKSEEKKGFLDMSLDELTDMMNVGPVQKIALEHGFDLGPDPRWETFRKRVAASLHVLKSSTPADDAISNMFGDWSAFKVVAASKHGCWWWAKNPQVDPLPEDFVRDSYRAARACARYVPVTEVEDDIAF